MPQTYSVGARSIFVTVTAWVFIILAAASSVSALVQHALAVSLLPQTGSANLPSLPLFTGLLVGYLPWVVGFGFLLSVATLASAIGLLLRLDWARRTFIGLLAFAIVANLLGLWLQQEMMQSVIASALASTPLPAQVAGVFGGFVTAARVMAVLMTLAACGLLVWIIRRLMSPMVRQEFA